MRPHSCSPKEVRLGLHSAQPASIAIRVSAALKVAIAGCVLLTAPHLARAQQEPSASQAATPEAPQAVHQSSASSEDRLPQTKRILGVVPNFKSVSTDEKLPRQSVKDKFIEASQDSFDYSSLALPGGIAAYSMAADSYPEFHQGAAGYARYYWHAAVDQTSENYMVEFVMPVLTREDTRYYTLGRGSFMKRTGYALSRAYVTRTDAGNPTFNFSEVAGAGASAGLSSLYYPTRERSFSNVATEWGVDVGIDSASFLMREFWPDINRRLTRRHSTSGTMDR